MHGELAPWPLLALMAATWIGAVWLLVVPLNANASPLRIAGLQSYPRLVLVAKIVAAMWVVLLPYAVWLSTRALGRP
jgi:hypothetical protein